MSRPFSRGAAAAALSAALLIAPPVRAGGDSATRGTLCFSDSLAVAASDASCRPFDETREPPKEAKLFFWLSEARTSAALGPAAAAKRIASTSAIIFRLAADAKRNWPAATEWSIASKAGTWTMRLDARASAAIERLRLPPGCYELTIAARGFYPLTRRIDLQSGADARQGSLTLNAKRSVRGTVVDAAEHPIAGAQATSAGEALGVTAPDGTFAGTAEGAMPARVTIEAGGFAPAVVEARADLVDIDLGTVTLRRGQSLVVKLARPCPAACETTLSIVALEPARTGPQQRVVASKKVAEGAAEVRFNNVPQGSYLLIVRGEAPLQQKQQAVIVGDAPARAEVAIEPAELAGTVHHGTRPFAHATLAFVFGDRLLRGTLSAGDDGAYATEIWSEGSYLVQISGGTLAGSFDEVRRLEGERRHVWNVTVPEGEIGGRVYDAETNESITSAKVSESYLGSWSYSGPLVPVDDEGHYLFQGMRPGEHRVSAVAAGYAAIDPVRVDMTSGEHRTVNIALRRATMAYFRVIGPDGRPLPDAAVAIADDLDGGFSFDLNAVDSGGVVGVPIRKAGRSRNAYALSRDAFGSVYFGDRVPTADKPLDIVAAPAPAHVVANVTGAGGEAVSGVWPMVRFNGRFVAPGVIRAMAVVQQFSPVSASGRLTIGRWPVGTIEIFPYIGSDEGIAVLRGLTSQKGSIQAVPGENVVELKYARR